eukprot:CAMPEP_0180684434 /NCGR_PEP_ID=MMETSP1037_2-20121125/71797_1 /TAXON_ID=632150 /ORGANISM="Azadinium spinosum, Strain 3D9" /LENGTH=71 /DNA_ID=CAMNT_0022714911 /DNA_START=82 /DNA_END=297 /DNA_ORIENTATION=+
MMVQPVEHCHRRTSRVLPLHAMARSGEAGPLEVLLMREDVVVLCPQALASSSTFCFRSRCLQRKDSASKFQ